MSDFSPSRQELAELAQRIRAALEAVRQANSNALESALAAGDALNAAQERVSSGWGHWLRTNCSLKPSTALLYQQLARHRSEIEARIEEIGALSLRAARRLVTKKPKTTISESEKLTLLTAMNKATDAELTEALIALSFERFMRVMPADWMPKLEARAGGQMISRAKAQHPNVRLKHLDKQCLRLVSSTEHPTPTH
jgi:hypothetical protein